MQECKKEGADVTKGKILQKDMFWVGYLVYPTWGAGGGVSYLER